MKLSALLFSIATYASTASGQRGGNMMRGSIAATFIEADNLFEKLVQSSNTPPPYPNGNDMTPQEYCPHLGSDFPPEDGCYPGGGKNIIGYPSCCAKHERGSGSCPKGHRPRCEKKMADAPSYCADLRPDFTCYVQGWPHCCMTDGTTCPISYVPACDVRSYDPPTKKSRKKSPRRLLRANQEIKPPLKKSRIFAKKQEIRCRC